MCICTAPSAVSSLSLHDALPIYIGAHPVGTGPYMLGEYRRSAHIELLKNPKFREMTYSPAGSVPATSQPDRKSTRLNSSHTVTSYAVFCLKKKKERITQREQDRT